MSYQIPPLNLDKDKFQRSPGSPRSYFLKSVSHGQLHESPLRTSKKIDSSPIRAQTDAERTSPIFELEEEEEEPNCLLSHRTLSSPQQYSSSRRHRNRRGTYTLSRSGRYSLDGKRGDESISMVSSKTPILPPLSDVSISRQISSRTQKNGPMSPRLTSPQLSPRNQPKSPQTPRGTIRSSYVDFIQYVKQRSSGANSPRPAEIVAFCKSDVPICLFYRVQSRREIGRVLHKHPKLWRHLLTTINYPTKPVSLIEAEILYDILNGLKIEYQLPSQQLPVSHTYSFKKLPLNEIKDSVKEKRYLVLMKDGQVQEVIDSNDPDLLVYNFKRNYHRYVPIFKWFQEHDYQDFKTSSPRLKNLYQIVMNMGAHKLFGYIDNTEYSSKEYVKLVVCSVYS
jgi:hypothetical protein